MIYLTLFFEFFKIGALTFGGGYAMIPFITDTVVAHDWMTVKELVDFIAVSESTPGAFAVNISTYVGSEVGGLFGAFCATFGLVLPPFILIIIIARIYQKFKESIVVKGMMLGLKSTVVGLIGATAVSVGLEVFFGTTMQSVYAEGIDLGVFSTSGFYVTLGIFAVMLFLLLYKKLSPIIIIGLSAAIGIIAGYTGLIQV